MKFVSLFSLYVALGTASAFQIARAPPPKAKAPQSKVGPLFSTLDGTGAASLDKSIITSGPKDRLLQVAAELKDQFGVFVIDKSGQEKLRMAVDDLEAVAERPSFDDDVKKTMLGNWTLLCTTSKSSALPSPFGNGIETSKLPLFNEGPLKEIRNSLNKYLTVQQVIYAKDTDEIDRVDHVLEYKPPSNLQDIFEKLPSLNINPLDITKGKVVLVHDADVSNAGPAFSIRLKLASVVVNVAGTSQFLESNGKDVLGLNSPLKEFQAGTFETTYLDDNLRISRSTRGPIDQLRVFVRSEPDETPDDYLDEEYFDEFDKFGEEDEGETGSDEDDLDPGLEN